MLPTEAASVLKLKNNDDDGIVLDGSLLEDVVSGIGAGAMDDDSPHMGTSDNNNDDDVHRCHLAGLSFWVQTLKLNILISLSLDPLDMSTAQRNFASHHCSMGRGGGWRCCWWQRMRVL